MASAAQIEVRPRTTGEILDDAWRLYLANVPLLLALSSLFTAPIFMAMIWLLTRQAPSEGLGQLVWPAVAAILLPLAGLGSGACQEVFRRGAEGITPNLGGCLIASFRQAGNHAAACALLSALFFMGSWLLLLPGLAVLISAVCVHPILAAGERRIFAALRASSQEAQRQPVKAGAVVLSRFPLLLLAVVNLYLLVRLGLWTAEHLAGFDVALTALLLSVDNPAYLSALVMLAWLLLAPYFEAANYLVHVDARARYEGLDLWYRVQRFFPLDDRRRAGVFLLAAGAALLAPISGSANDAKLSAVEAARREVHSIAGEIARAEPYAGSERWNARLRAIVTRLDRDSPAGKSRYRWFHRAIEGFGHRGRESALKVLTDLDLRLGLIEESFRRPGQPAQEDQDALSNEDLKRLLPPDDDAGGAKKPEVREARRRPGERNIERRAQREEPEVDVPGRAGPRGPGLVAPHPQGGFASLGWLIVGGIFLAVLIVGLMLFLQGRRQSPARQAAQQTGEITPSLESIVTRPDEYSVSGLWREADNLARAGRARDAVRTLYLAVLALLHRANLIRFERTRTNGEYVRQLRSRETLRTPFAGMTSLFEVKWYSESTCEASDYTTCRALAENIRENLKNA